MTEKLNEQVSSLLQEIQAGLQKQGFIQSELPTHQLSFNAQVNAMRDARLAEKHDPVAGGAAKQVGIAYASAKNANLMEVARRIARELGANGPITSDDVTDRLRKDGHESAADVDPSNRRLWKGGLFTISEWVCVGSRPSRITANHARPIKLWALKTWLVKNSLNGSNLVGSAFSTIKTMHDFQRANPGVTMDMCNWYVGTGKLGTETDGQIKAEKQTLYGAPVMLVPNAVGAILMLANKLQPGQPVPMTEPVQQHTGLDPRDLPRFTKSGEPTV